MGTVVDIESARIRNIRSAVRSHCDSYHIPESIRAQAVTVALAKAIRGSTLIEAIGLGIKEADRLYGLWLDSFSNKFNEEWD